MIQQIARAAAPGDRVEWTSASFILDTRGEGEIVHVWGPHAVVFNPAAAARHPHLSPYVVKRLDELRLAPIAIAA